jgi:hypothetical protein
MSSRNALIPRRSVALTVALLSGMLLPEYVQAQTGSAEFLRERLGFSRLEVMALEGGRYVVKVPKSDDPREVAILGAVRVGVPLEFLVDCFRDVEGFLAGHDIVTQVGSFNALPSRADLEHFSLPEKDVKALRECEVGHCKVKLSGGEIERVHRNVNWSQPDYQRQASDVMIHALIQTLRSYKSEGNAGLPIYYDKREPRGSGEDFRILLARSRQHFEGGAELYGYMADFPASTLTGVEDVYYWTVEDFGMKPVTSLNHMMMLRHPEGDSSRVAIAIKQIYASHYFQSAIRLATLTQVSTRYPLRGTYLVLVANMRFDGRVGGFKRGMLERQLENVWARYMVSLRERAEESYQLSRVAAR